VTVIAVVAFFSKCLLGGLAIFMMADNKKQRVSVKFCFLLGSEQCLLGGLAIFMMADNKEERGSVKFCLLLGSEQCLLGGLAIFVMADNTEKRGCVKFCFLFGTVRRFRSVPNKKKKLHAPSFFCIICHHKNRQTSKQALRKKATTTITLNLDRRQATDC
jgi:hypothetical protein